MRWIRFTTDGRTTYGSLNGDTWGAHSATGKSYKLSDVKLEVPVIPRTFYSAGINYAAHIREKRRSAACSRCSRRRPTSATAPTTR